MSHLRTVWSFDIWPFDYSNYSVDCIALEIHFVIFMHWAIAMITLSFPFSRIYYFLAAYSFLKSSKTRASQSEWPYSSFLSFTIPTLQNLNDYNCWICDTLLGSTVVLAIVTNMLQSQKWIGYPACIISINHWPSWIMPFSFYFTKSFMV